MPESLLWHEGMLLAPQHLQQQGIYFDRLIRFRNLARDAYDYGVVDLKIDKGALTGGLFRVITCTAILPDGLLVQMPAPDGRILDLDLNQMEDRLRLGPVRIEMIVATEGPATEKTTVGRFKEFSGDNVADMNGTPGLVSVPRLLADVRLQLADGASSRFTSLPIAEVELVDENYSLTPYVPPCLRLLEDCQLFDEFLGLARRIREKAVFLSERSKAQEQAGLGPGELRNELMLMALVQNLSEFEGLLGSRNARPFDLYLALCRISGSCAILGDLVLPPNGRGYTHENIRSCSDPLVEFINGTLERILQEYVSVPFEQTDHGFRLLLADKSLEDTLVAVARSSVGVSISDTWRWLEDALICAPENRNDLSARRALGAERELVQQSDAETFGVSGEVVLFRININDQSIDRSGIMEVLSDNTSARPSQIMAFMKSDQNSQ